ncbi:MAG: CRTAC1 family protein, partial [Saprospiraceae bacterium]|nr:CRTAC1 family protein [Saprospiraceae bacterium]
PRGPHESDRLYRNEGNGAFTDVSEQAGIVNRAFGLSVTVSDFNHDGYPDLYVGNDYIEPDYLYINNRNGTFTDRIDEYFRHTSNHTMGVDIADFNNDGMVDVAALDMIAEDNRRQKLLMTTMDLQRYNTLVRYGYGHQIMRNVLQLNTGEGGFADVGTFAGISNTDWSWSVLFQDFDNDGWKDLYITNGYRRDVTNMDYLTYTVDSLNRTGGINKQRFPEFDQFLNMIPSERLQNYLFRNKGDLSFEKVTDSWGLPERSFSNGSAYADLDGDGDEEIITNNIADPAFVYRNLSREKYPERHYLQIALQESGKNTKAVGAKVQLYCGDRQQYQEVTPTRGFFSSSSTILHFGLGDCASVDRIEITWPDGAVQVLDQVAADQRLTVEKGNTTAQTAKKAAKNEFFRPATGLGLDFIHQENEFEDFDRERLLPHRLSR